MNGARGFNNYEVPLITRISIILIPIIFAPDEEINNGDGEDN